MKALATLVCMLSVAAGWARPAVFKPSDARLAFDAAAELVRTCTPRDAGTAEGRRAADLIRRQLQRHGVKAEVKPFVAKSCGEIRSYANVVVEFPGISPTEPWIVLMSHFDTKPGIPGFQGANDGASTSGLLVALAGAVARMGPLKENVCLAWTDAEECRVAYADDDGFQGSKYLAKQFRDQKRGVKAAICLDMLGDRNLDIIVPYNGDPALRTLTLGAAVKIGYPNRVSLRDDLVVGDDHSAFLDAGFPAIDLIDFDYGHAPGANDYWHTNQDTLEQVSSSSLFISGRIVVELVNLLTAPAHRSSPIMRR